MDSAGTGSPRVVCLLPARNAEGLLGRWLSSVSPFVDAVVALDDGSTDATSAMLEDHPLVARLLRNPPRDGWVGWDDSRNRNRLLAAAGELAPDWVIGIDADELVPPEDGAALRRFITDQAVPGVAYGFPVYRMIGDLDHHDGAETISYRLFAFDPKQRFPQDQLHFDPVPTDIPRGRWLVANIGIQHLSGLTPELRRARRQKYAEVDPHQRWEDDYSYIDAPPGRIRPWRSRGADQPVVLTARYGDWAVVEPDLAWPVLSVALVAEDATVDEMARLWETVGAEASPRMEVLVVATSAAVADDMGRLCPGATVVREPGRSSSVGARNLALRVARGDYVICFDGPAEIEPGALEALVKIHDRGNAVVSCPSVNDVSSGPGWASYFRAPELCSFAREPLARTGGFDPEMGGWVDREARLRLVDHGHHVGHNPLITGRHRSAPAGPADYLRRCHALGRVGSEGAGAPFPLVRRARTDLARYRAAQEAARRSGPEAGQAFRRVRPLVVGGMAASWVGAAADVVRRRVQDVRVRGGGR